MKKTMILIAGFVVLFTSVSAAVDDHRTARFGEETPAVVVEQQGSRISLDAYRGKWVSAFVLGLDRPCFTYGSDPHGLHGQ